ncbi:nuclear transport factor 2 family protein [Rhodococcus sp. H29-C3]|nr:nuclear transport factor 2 family protein [Rhodococcus sp. H29-C3]MDJ0363290.1 nuclear transport factor 2 family protein [Rhodococcus sp. H29-C3]
MKPKPSFLRVFRANDIDGLDSILHADVEFVGPDGSIIDKDAWHRIAPVILMSSPLTS